MKFTAWEQKRHIERSYNTALKKLVKWINEYVERAQDYDDILADLNDASQSPQLDAWANAVANRMVTSTLNETARTWREAARESSEGQRMYNALQKEMEGPVGDRVRELIDRNAQFIKSVPQDVALEIVKHTQTQAFADNRDIYTTDKFKELVGDMSEKHAKLISRTETAKAHAALVQARAENLGLDWYIWRTAQDVRTRDSHRLMDDVMCRFSDPPSPEELNGEERTYGHYHPGNIFNCRCYAAVIVNFKYETWPHKVYADGVIQTMAEQEFKEQFGEGRIDGFNNS